MKRILMSAACAASLMSGVALAEDESPWKVSGTVAVTSNYMFRGFTQSNTDPAVQASVTVAHESGFYAGFWGSSIDFNDGFFTGNASELEVDIFAGYGFSLGENTALDLNFTYYAYPGSPSALDYEFFEIAATLTHDFGFAKVGVKGAYTPDFFGVLDESAFWLNGTLTVPFSEWLSASGNVGYQWLDFNDDYFAYDVGLTATYENVSFDARYIATDLDFVDEEFVFTVSFAF